jgi:hypothetical protein
MRASTLLAFLIAASAPSVARAQQQPIPPVGEPPSAQDRTQEKAAIENEARQAYAQAHKDEFWSQAQSEVEQERYNAWAQRGRDNIPPPVTVRPPTLEANLTGRWGLGGPDELGLGISGALKLRMKRWWGLEAAGGLLAFRNFASASPPDARFTAAFAELSGIAWFSTYPKRFTSAGHGFFRVGTHLVFPLKSPNLPPVYLAPFGGVGGVFALGTLAKGKVFTAILFEYRVGYRFELSSAPSSPIKGLMVDIVTGPVVGF